MIRPNHFLAAATLSLTGGAALADGFYIKAYGALSALQGNDLTLGGATSGVDYDTGFGVGGAIGYDYPDSPFRSEVEYAYRTGDATGLGAVGTSGDFASTTVMINGYYRFERESALIPYVGLGLGYVTEIDFDIEGGTGAGEYSDRGLLAWQAMAGVDYPVTESLSAFGELRYFSVASPNLSGEGTTLEADYDALEVVAGVSFSF